MPVPRDKIPEILRYWLASLQLDEALASRPRARRPTRETHAPRVDAPTPGQDYFKLPFDPELESVLCARGQLQRPLDAELGAFFEHWLATQYRRGRDEDREVSHLLVFPVVHLPRGELAGLLRYDVSLRFCGADGSEFTVPTRAQRRTKVFPPAPSEARLRAGRSERQLPFFVDTRLLQQQLGVPREHIDAFFAELRARPQVTERDMLGRVCELLEAELPPDDQRVARSAQNPLARLTAGASALLQRRGARARVYPVSIVLDGTPAKTTWYLQRELQALLDEDLQPKACLESYLTGAALPVERAPQRALFPGLSLSDSQRAAAERCWGSRLTAVQGPPGTGKTTLILHLAAQAIVQQVEMLADRKTMGDGLFVVTSTNNRAVDNVVDPLTESALPLALRAGSQRVCEHVLAVQLAGVRSWLDAARARPEAEREAQLEAALDHFRRVRRRLKPDDTASERALFEAAVAAREAWAAAESVALCSVVDEAFSVARDERSLRSLWDKKSWSKLRELFGVWGCTLLSLGNCFPQAERSIERLVVDEAGQCHPAYGVSGLLRAESALIIGDVHQLEPVIDLEPEDDARVLGSCKLTLSPEELAPYRVHSTAHNSVQSLADRAVLERPRLREHFRCQPEIIAICDTLCDYGLRVHTEPGGPTLGFLPHPVSLLHVAGEQERLAGSWYNPAELALCVELLLALDRSGVDPSDVAIITPYRGQLEQLRRQLVRLGIPIDHSVELGELDDLPLTAANRGVGLGTVHRFQGGERSVVLFSSVVTRRASLGFLDDRENLLNVAVSRARHKLVVLGDRGVLETGSRTRVLVDAARPVSADAFRSQLTLGA